MLEARSGDGVVFLDLETDQYSCCYDPERPIGNYAELLAPVRAIGHDHAHPIAASPWIDARPSDMPRPHGLDIVRFFFALVRASLRSRSRSVAHLASVARTLRAKTPAVTMTPQEAANLFRYLLSLTPFRPKCLLGSFALLHFLDSYGLRASWVFGVQLFPFRAHCWVVSDGVLLNERRHGIEDYRVIWTITPTPR